MKIDEHISLCRVCAEDLRNTAKRFNNAQMKEDAKEWDELADMLEELQWYREQDLIQREDAEVQFVPSPRDCKYPIKTCIGCEYEDSCRRIAEIPKAEPPVDKDINVHNKPKAGAHCSLCDYSVIPDYYLCALCEYKDEKAESCYYCKHNLDDKECKECNFESLV